MSTSYFILIHFSTHLKKKTLVKLNHQSSFSMFRDENTKHILNKPRLRHGCCIYIKWKTLKVKNAKPLKLTNHLYININACIYRTPSWERYPHLVGIFETMISLTHVGAIWIRSLEGTPLPSIWELSHPKICQHKKYFTNLDYSEIRNFPY